MVNEYHQMIDMMGSPTCPKVQAEIRLGPYNLTPLHEFVCSELIALLAQPCQLRPSRSILSRPDSVKPVIRCDEIPAWISNDRDIQLPHGTDYIFTEPILIYESVVFVVWIVQSSIDATTHVFRKAAIDVVVYFADSVIRMYYDFSFVVSRNVCVRRHVG